MESDPKATPINALPKGNLTQEDDQQFIQNILNQMKGDSQESEQNYQQAQQKYNNQQFGHSPAEQPEQNQDQLQAQYEQEEQEEQYEDEPVKQTFGDKLKRAIKGPLLFFILYVLLCFPFVRVFVANQIARFTENEYFHVYGATVLLGLIGGVIFYLVSTFLF